GCWAVRSSCSWPTGSGSTSWPTRSGPGSAWACRSAASPSWCSGCRPAATTTPPAAPASAGVSVPGQGGSDPVQLLLGGPLPRQVDDDPVPRVPRDDVQVDVRHVLLGGLPVGQVQVDRR